MIKDKLFRLLTALAFITTFNSSIYTSPAWSQRTPPETKQTLFSGAQCVTSSTHHQLNFEKADSPQNVSVSRKLYTYSYSMYTYKDYSITVTCKTNPKKFSTLKLKMGVSDNANGVAMSVNIYQGGNKQHTYGNLRAGSLVNSTLDLRSQKIDQPEDVAIEMVCEQAGNYTCRVLFFDAQLLP